jgi:iron complex transport system substrate-binding protein
VLGLSGERSVRIDWSAIAEGRPDLIVVAPCGFGLAAAKRLAFDLVDNGLLPPGVPVWAVDADAAFVRPGPRLVDGVETLAAICHPQRVGMPRDLADYVGMTSAKTKPSRSTISPTVTSSG